MNPPLSSPRCTLVLILIVIAVLTAPAARAEAPNVLGLADAIRIAWEQGPDMEEERRALADAELQARRAGVPYRPEAGLSAGYDVREGADGEVSVILSLGQSFALKPLLGGAAPAEVRKAQAALEQARRRLETARQETARSVLNAYLDLLEARETVARREAAVQTASALLEQTELRARQQAASEADLYQARADLLAARQSLAQAQLEATRSETALNRLLGLPLRAPLELTGIGVPGVQPSTLPGLDTLTAHALAYRLDLVEAREALAEALASLDELKRPFEPTLSLTAGYAGEDASLQATLPLDTWEMKVTGQADIYGSDGAGTGVGSPLTGWSAGVGISLPLLDGGGRRAAREAQALQVKRLQARLEELEASAAEEVRQALESYTLALEALPVRDLQLEAAQLRLEAEERRFEAGAITPRELADARSAYETALAGQISARFQVLRAAAELQRAAALPVTGPDGAWLTFEEALPQEED